ncbi:MAG: class II fructose-bisphosphate aldolase [Deltaproteobacteria bacterium]|nr:class II fructose-bisphosphate aldolase [Deltaproteobacteria bacterium]
MAFKSIGELYDSLKGAVRGEGDGFVVTDEERLRGEPVDGLIYNAVFNADKGIRNEALRVIHGCAGIMGVKSSSIQNLYEAMGRGECGGFTVPAINIRGMTYDASRAVFRAAKSQDCGTFIFEIAKSEIDYTGQRPSEYASCVLAAAIKEGFSGPVFLQGDHFQVNAKKYGQDKSAEINALKKLIKEALEAGFLNIDIDASTIVDLSKSDVGCQQKPNIETTAALTIFIREGQRKGQMVSIGGEIGEVGGKNSTVEDLRAFMDGYLGILGGNFKGISKISVQTGTTHGGVVLPDGTMAKVKVDFNTIENLSGVARREYGLAGIVQHGASTLPDDAFGIFPKRGAAEVHLATGFQNMTYDSPAFPEALKKEIYDYLKDKGADEKKEGETEEQFIYKTRKKGFGPFKEKIWNIPSKNRENIGLELEERFTLLFKKLNVVNTAALVKKHVG